VGRDKPCPYKVEPIGHCCERMSFETRTSRTVGHIP
jgi:hypothetical protein